jgi:hypothetical protein
MLKPKVPGIKTNGSRFVRLHYNEDGSPVRRTKPKAHMGKKERRKRRREQ